MVDNIEDSGTVSTNNDENITKPKKKRAKRKKKSVAKDSTTDTSTENTTNSDIPKEDNKPRRPFGFA